MNQDSFIGFKKGEGALSMTKLQPFKLCISSTSMTCIRNAMNFFHFIPALVTLGPILTTPKKQIVPSMETGSCYYNFFRLTFLGSALTFLQYED
ncbi:hypothetical protein RO3G_02269 [Rhizopus delemar RA 99-880]|uniref:Uncharacterized protein n=1 Tax=Rhizopus delemar (strain RA 99-880 / ATCC MYA-4621 / FGSC 9543 / NRRL 43880) TaxID=246409 RepID=I1BMY5_RHIO9|nr:hypothetical protein RO3G_02269 [Rhizopus delemar RA 99-880]|eukprot:EIE77565.1 hypothetical protein RO3G_02269 [Rhizopus delemar RA 99-880]